MATNCCYNLPFITDIRTPGGATGPENYVQQTFNLNYQASNPANETTYYFMNPNTLEITFADRNNSNMIWGKDCTVVNATVDVYVGGTLASGETSGVELLDSSDIQIININDAVKFNTSESHYQWSGTALLTADTEYRFALTTPAWVTSPTLAWLSVTLIFKL